jgi:hypothetical protein
VFGKVVVASPAQHPGRGQPEAGYNGSPPLVWVLGPTEPGHAELVFGHHLGAGLAAQLPPTAEAGWCLAPSQAAQAPGFIPISHTQYQTNNLPHNFIYDFIITFIKSYNCSHNYNIISSSSQLQIASEKYLYHYK